MKKLFSDEDRKKIIELEQEFSKLKSAHVRLESLISVWQEYVVIACERGYHEEVEEYMNDLSLRVKLAKFYDTLSEDGKKKLSIILEDLDNRFRHQTIEIQEPIISYDYVQKNKHWWFWRIPKRISKEEISGFESRLGYSLKGLVETF